jgi:hypothetical protein
MNKHFLQFLKKKITKLLQNEMCVQIMIKYIYTYKHIIVIQNKTNTHVYKTQVVNL